MLMNLFRHPAAQSIQNLKELSAAGCHLFLRKEKEFWDRTLCDKYAHNVQKTAHFLYVFS
jgi:hypothetical protein